jgi:hypothetical protein
MTSLEKSKEQYLIDVDSMAKKSRYGFFSILPSYTAGITAFGQKSSKT